MELKEHSPSLKQAVIDALDQSFPTIITSGAILASAGALIGQLSTDGTISAIGVCLGRGTVISIFLVMGVLPQIMLIGAALIDKTSFTMKRRERTVVTSGRLAVTGMVHGYVNGRIDGIVNGIISGDVDVRIDRGNADTENAEGGSDDE